MRIKQLELVGFKSFPQSTVLEFPAGVTAVVGPNGCGKSNVVDAIRWALGEQSAKHLRGEAMEDVIFNGNERLAPLGMAEVSLTFQNDTPAKPLSGLDLELSTVPAHFRDLAEIVVTRRYFRSGESEYYINKTGCRLKDITELFLGTGIGAKAYAVVEQGRVEQLINAKPEERRLFIEEAAGTTLYRSRRLAAERKMERTRENLARVNDVLREIERQVQYLQRQAKKAEAHRRLGAEVRTLELRLTGGQWRALRDQVEELGAEGERLTRAQEELRAEQEAREEAQRAAAAALSGAERHLAELRERVAVLEAERQSGRERVELLTLERDERERRRGRLAGELEANGQAQIEAGEQLESAEREREATGAALRREQGELGECEDRLAAARAALAGAQAALEASRGALVDHMTREVEARNALAGLERRGEEVARQLDKLRAEEAELNQRLLDIDRRTVERGKDLAALRERLAAATGEQEKRAEALRALAETRRHAERLAAARESALLQTRSRLESLEQIQGSYEGFDRGVRAIMQSQQSGDGVLGVVADVIDIPEKYERAAAAVLGDRLQYMIVRGEEDGADAVDRLRHEASGRGSFIPLHPRYQNGAISVNGASQRLLELVRFDDSFRSVAESLLGEVVLVPDLRAAVSLWRQNGVQLTLVTPEGDVMDPSGVITGGSDKPIEQEILARRREIESLREAAAGIAGQLAEEHAALERTGQAMREAESALEEIGEGTHDLAVEIVSAEKDIERLDSERPQCASRREVIRYEMETLAAEGAALKAEGEELRGLLAELDARHCELEQEAAGQSRRSEDATGQAESLSTAVTAMKVRVAEHRARQEAAVAAVEALRRQSEQLSERQRIVAAELRASEQERDGLERDIAAARQRETEREARRGELQEEIDAAAAAVEGCREVVRVEEQRRRENQVALEQTHNERSRVEVAHSEVRLRAEHVAQAMRERYETDLAAQPEEQIDAETQAAEGAKLEALKGRLARLGEVNVAAIDELRELEERSAFLRAQRDDLERSLADLEHTIQKLNRASRTRFAETFARANETFQKVCPRLFRGGEGRLVLTDEHNLLETGVEIIVRPPGKRLDGIGLLSGGEKALVAVSLIFSLFLINPTPFCVLDEVDAPLDDANIDRFSQMIGEMSDHSQFILVTHNKRTMESAGVMYGITMKEPGVSKVISASMTQ